MFKIGDFSRLARVSIKTLRHYDEEGLLAPAATDPQSGYRYYSANQLETLQRILLLKELGFSLTDIRTLLSMPNSSEFEARLHARKQELQQEIARDMARLRYIEALTQSGPNCNVAVCEIPSVTAYCQRTTVPHLGLPVEALFERAEEEVARSQLRVDASPFLIFHDPDYRDRDLDVEVCIPVRREDASKLVSRTLPAQKAACVTYGGEYRQTWPIYAAMLRWLEAARCEIAGPLREVYHRYGAHQRGYRLPGHVLTNNPGEYVTELVVPIGDCT